MSKLNIDQKTVKGLFQDSKSDFLIPDYQRPYAWGDVECKTLREGLFSFSFPNENSDRFNDNDEYFLGPIVTFKNNDKKGGNYGWTTASYNTNVAASCIL